MTRIAAATPPETPPTIAMVLLEDDAVDPSGSLENPLGSAGTGFEIDEEKEEKEEWEEGDEGDEGEEEKEEDEDEEEAAAAAAAGKVVKEAVLVEEEDREGEDRDGEEEEEVVVVVAMGVGVGVLLADTVVEGLSVCDVPST